MATAASTKRLRQDYLRLQRDPVPYVEATPLPSNMLEWRDVDLRNPISRHYVVKGPEDTPYYGGFYHGKLIFPKDYPFKPPRIIMVTPNGRFQTNTRLCLSISDFHPDLWNPAWSVATILTGLLSFMVESTATLGSIDTPVHVKKQLAISSWSFNLQDRAFSQLFPHLCEEIKEKKEEYERQVAAQNAQNSLTSGFSQSSPNNSVIQYGYCNGMFGNFVLFASLACFVYVVHYLISNMV